MSDLRRKNREPSNPFRPLPKPEINFAATPKDRASINRIVARAMGMAAANGFTYERQDASMDLTACHMNGCTLDLAKLEAADDFNFSHDVFGIRRHLDRNTGQLLHCFVPRCARRPA